MEYPLPEPPEGSPTAEATSVTPDKPKVTSPLECRRAEIDRRLAEGRATMRTSIVQFDY